MVPPTGIGIGTSIGPVAPDSSGRSAPPPRCFRPTRGVRGRPGEFPSVGARRQAGPPRGAAGAVRRPTVEDSHGHAKFGPSPTYVRPTPRGTGGPPATHDVHG